MDQELWPRSGEVSLKRRAAKIARRVLVLSIAIAAGASAAEPTDGPGAEALFRAGRDAADHGQARLACERFRESYRLDPAPGTLLNIAACEESLGELATAWEHYRHVADELSPSDDRLPVVRERLTALEPRVPHLVLTLDPNSPPDTIVFRDGVALTRTSLGLELPTNPGTHEVRVVAKGRVPKQFDVSVAEGERQELRVEAGSIVPPTRMPERMPPATTRASEPSRPLRAAAYVSLGVGASAALLGAAAGIGLVYARGTIDGHCPTASSCDDEGVRAAGAAKTLQTEALALGALAVVASGTAAVTWYLSAPRRVASAPRVSASLWFGGVAVSVTH